MRLLSWLRGQDSNLRPRGYEPRELPLLHPASSVELYKFLYLGNTIKQRWNCQLYELEQCAKLTGENYRANV